MVSENMKNDQADNMYSLVHGQRETGLVLSADAKPRLKWTPELHQRFVDAVSRLGGAEKATPKSVMRVMGVPGLTLYHLKSHLQKYRLGKSQQPITCDDNKEEVTDGSAKIKGVDINDENMGRSQTSENDLQIAKALLMQMEVQKKLHEQMEVQRHLQLRIEAQGKYLQSVLRKAQETLAGYNSSIVGLESTKSELLELVSMVDAECASSSLSELTELSNTTLEKGEKKLTERNFVPHQPVADSSMDSCLTSSESSEKKDEKLQTLLMNSACARSDDVNYHNGISMLSSIDTNASKRLISKISLNNQVVGAKRSCSTSDDTIEQPASERLHQERANDLLKRFRPSKGLDLNSQYHCEIDSGRPELDLNCWN